MFAKIWNTAAGLAEKTPPERNRYVDFLRALSILFVIVGHWLIAAAIFNEQTGSMDMVDIFKVKPSTQWLTWLFQVMPIFFIVGGYSNAISLRSAEVKNLNYAEWLSGRLHRLLTPLMVLVFAWVGIAFLMRIGGAKVETIKYASKAAIIPCWFLAIYTMIVMLAPLMFKIWKKWGWASLVVLVGFAALTDVAFFKFDQKWTGWSNYFWVWLAVHHLGFAWFDGKLGKPFLMLIIGLVALALLYYVVQYGPYPLAMAASPDKAVSNSLPPKITLFILGVCQFGFLHAFQKPMQQLLQGKKLWTATVLINSMIMSVYLWHMTILLVVVEISYLLGGVGMQVVPVTAEWWLTRPVWIVFLTVLLLPVALLVSPLERMAKPKTQTPSALRLVFGATAAGFGLALIVINGFEGSMVDTKAWLSLGLFIVGALIAGVKVISGR